MLESVAWRSFNSTSICASVSFALATYEGGRAGQTHRWAKRVKRVSQVRNTKTRGRSGEEVREKTYCFSLKSLDGLHVRADVVRDGFKFAQDLLHFIHNAFIL
jgi:hypothetical protein